ncbi:MAG TPA: S8 family serine peptidase, partial [Candidatus Binatia bacterium]|nr:S8 family serine peptidase [Candidatus Binatia bacterium]
MRLGLLCGITLLAARALAEPDPIGLATLRRLNPTLTGAGVAVGQVEASSPGWQANPAAVGMAECQMTWIGGAGLATTFPNDIGSESGHADEVSRSFFSVAAGATRFANYEASYFANAVIPGQLLIDARIVNQSFVFYGRIGRIDQLYDNYAAKYNVLFVSGAGNSGSVRSPGTAYNSISVGAFGGTSAVGPATDGRCKPDITAPASATSFSTPLVSGAAALLLQAGATDIRLLKALILNGAVKPLEWTNTPTAPLDSRYGAGIANVFNSWRHFRAGQQAPGIIKAHRGWDLATIDTNQVKQYAFDAPISTITATLVWLRNYGCTNVSNLNLTLRSEDGEVIGVSMSAVDNVEHLHLPHLLPGRYVLEVSSDAPDTYALAFDSGPSTPPGLQPWTLTGEPNQRYLIESTVDLRNW